MTFLLALPILIPIASASFFLLLGRFSRLKSSFWNVPASALLLISSAVLWESVWSGGTRVLQIGNWAAPFGITLVADLFSATMVLVTGLMGFVVSLFLQGEEKNRRRNQVFYFVAFQTLLMGVCGSFLTGDLFNLYVWFEVMLMSSFVLIAFEGTKPQLEGAFKYTVLNLMASVLFLAAVALLYASLGTLNMAHMSRIIAEKGSSSAVKGGFALLLAAFGMKAGVFPLFFWLPAAYHTPRIATISILAALLTKVGVYSLFRVVTLIFSQTLSFTQPLLVIVACLTMVTGVLGAASHYDIRRILSFHIISQIGYMILGLAIWTPASIAAGFFYMLHNILAKTNLFLISGVIHQIKGTTQLKLIGGLFRQVPWLAVFFLIPALSLAGLPPLAGFFAKFSLFFAGFGEKWFVAVGIGFAVGLLTLFSMLKIWLEAFWKPQPENSGFQETRALQWASFLPSILMGILILIASFKPQILLAPAQRIGRELLQPSLYIEAVLKKGNP